MSEQWQSVEVIDGYERTYRNGRYRVAYRPLVTDAVYLHRDLFVDGRPLPAPLPPVHVESPDVLTDDFYLRSLHAVEWHI